MRYARIYDGNDGETHFEDVEVALTQVDLAPPAPLFDVSMPRSCRVFSFVHLPVGWYGDQHPAPRHLLWVYLSGDVEIETSDGELRQFRCGDMVLAEDTSGKGHVSRVVGSERSCSA
ncbi:MAG: cupin domain-containing protein [Chloroflexota bacterium]|nr:cupin domain-containing protein [Chloroflexota bacterium]